jgi:hypothetical protein
MDTVQERGVLAILLWRPVSIAAQSGSGIAGVKDSSGAVLPGVTVEASSPALIEKVRSVITDGEGQFKILGPVPGVYAVTFTLPGFNTVRHEGIELTASFTVTVNADLRVGALEETVTACVARRSGGCSPEWIDTAAHDVFSTAMAAGPRSSRRATL